MWGLLIFLVGLLYGWMTPGQQDKGRLLWNGFLMGIVIALALSLLGAALGSQPLPLGEGIVGIVLTVLILTVVFVAGAWLGDVIEGAVNRHDTRTV
jgi:CDP-diglyceride synthetase